MNTQFPQLEQSALDYWKEQNIPARVLASRQHAPAWRYLEGPPTANGLPGVHHVLARSLKDLYARFWCMQGYRVERRGGWDCHGLPVEREVQRALNLPTVGDVEEYGVERFNQKCRESVNRYVHTWQDMSERMGYWLEPGQDYWTMSEEYMQSVWWSLAEAYQRDLVYQGGRVSPHCPHCETTLSSHEVAQGYEQRTDTAAWVRFPLADDMHTSLVAWTTQPWTLVGNRALAVHAQAEYVVLSHPDDPARLVVMEHNLESWQGWSEQARLRGQDLAGRQVVNPWGEEVPVLAADWVSKQEGTGVVHVAPGHGADDALMATQYGLDTTSVAASDGRYAQGPWKGDGVREAEAQLLALLADRGLLVRSEEIQHGYPHCWRCQTPLILMNKPGWFARTASLREEMSSENQQVEWHPEGVRDGRFGKWLENNVDWALSRERFWGTPLPFWTCEAGHVEAVNSLATLAEKCGQAVTDCHREAIDHLTWDCACGKPMHRVPEVVDVWYDSGCAHFAAGGARPDQVPEIDLVCEGLDQTRGWFYSLLAVSTMLWGKAPYKTVLCHGLVNDAQGQKMSKSRNNSLDPHEVFDAEGADALRWYYACKRPWDGYALDLVEVRDMAAPLRRLVNVVSFVTTTEATASDDDRGVLEAWMHSRLASATHEVAEAFRQYDNARATYELTRLMDDLSGVYLRARRDAFAENAQVRAILHQALATVLALLAPVCPLLAEALWQELGLQGSVHEQYWPERGAPDAELEYHMTQARAATQLVHAFRAQYKLPLRCPLTQVTVGCDQRAQSALDALKDYICNECNLDKLVITDHSEIMRWQAVPNWKLFGKRFGRDGAQLAETLKALDQDEVEHLFEGGRGVDLVNGNRSVHVHPQEAELRMQQIPGSKLLKQGDMALQARAELSQEQEGRWLEREAFAKLQQARKQAGLKPGELAQAFLLGPSSSIDGLHAQLDALAASTALTITTVPQLDEQASGRWKLAARINNR